MTTFPRNHTSVEHFPISALKRPLNKGENLLVEAIVGIPKQSNYGSATVNDDEKL